MEEVAENLVKTWEMEASHKPDLQQWRSINLEKYCVQINNGAVMDGNHVAEIGNYNALMADSSVYQKCNTAVHIKIFKKL